MTRSDAGARSPVPASNFARSAAIVGEPKESTMTMVCPVPSMPRCHSGRRSYAVARSAGVSPVPDGGAAPGAIGRVSGEITDGERVAEADGEPAGPGPDA